MAVPPSRKAERVDEQVPVQLAMSLDGYVAGPDQSEEHPLGVGRDVPLGGGASVVQQYLAAGLVDEFELYLVAVLLGDGERLLENVDDLNVEQVRAIEAPGSPTSSTASSAVLPTPKASWSPSLRTPTRPSRPMQPWPRLGSPRPTCASTPASRSWTAGSGSRPNGAWPSASPAPSPTTPIPSSSTSATPAPAAPHSGSALPDKADADPVVRGLADHQVLHFRHYGHDRQDDLHIR
jgi:hypothetical protein